MQLRSHAQKYTRVQITHICNIHPVCKSAHVNGALEGIYWWSIHAKYEIQIETSTKMYTPFFNRIKLMIWTICAFRVLNPGQ